MKNLRWAIILAIVGLLFLGTSWATDTRPPLPEAVDALASDELVVVTHEPWLVFSPTINTTNTGFILYPGGRIDTRGYGSLMRTIAMEG